MRSQALRTGARELVPSRGLRLLISPALFHRKTATTQPRHLTKWHLLEKEEQKKDILWQLSSLNQSKQTKPKGYGRELSQAKWNLHLLSLTPRAENSQRQPHAASLKLLRRLGVRTVFASTAEKMQPYYMRTKCYPVHLPSLVCSQSKTVSASMLQNPNICKHQHDIADKKFHTWTCVMGCSLKKKKKQAH